MTRLEEIEHTLKYIKMSDQVTSDMQYLFDRVVMLVEYHHTLEEEVNRVKSQLQQIDELCHHLTNNQLASSYPPHQLQQAIKQVLEQTEEQE